MSNLGLNHGKTDGIKNCCYSCVSGEPEGPNNRVRCNNGTIMNPNEFCDNFCIDLSRTPEEVIDFVQDFIQKNLEN